MTQNEHIGGAIFPCPFCGGDLLWKHDFSFDEVFGEGRGVVSYYKCINDKCGALFECSLPIDEDAKERLSGQEEFVERLVKKLEAKRNGRN